jgi:hypothetical protein
MPLVGFEPTISMFQREKTVHALDGAATVIGEILTYNPKRKQNIGLPILSLWK